LGLEETLVRNVVLGLRAKTPCLAIMLYRFRIGLSFGADSCARLVEALRSIQL
jgi:hypothetical protein